jgi:hypothetical protein
MNGAIAEPLVNTISTPNKSRITIIGSSQNFFRTFKNCHKSLKNSIFKFLLKRFYDIFVIKYNVPFDKNGGGFFFKLF